MFSACKNKSDITSYSIISSYHSFTQILVFWSVVQAEISKSVDNGFQLIVIVFQDEEGVGNNKILFVEIVKYEVVSDVAKFVQVTKLLNCSDQINLG